MHGLVSGRDHADGPNFSQLAGVLAAAEPRYLEIGPVPGYD
jgi:hypothetical protein